MVLKNKKIWAIGLGTFVVSGVLAGVLVAVLSKTSDKKENKNTVLLNQLVNTKTEENAINILQNLYKLKNKTETEINNLVDGNIKTRYISALALAKKLFAIKSDYKMHLLKGKEKNSNLKEILLIATPKNIKKAINSKLAWPLNQIDQTHDQIALLITFFKNQVLKVETALANKESNIAIGNAIFFKLKSYDLVDLFYKFKLTKPSATNFETYNAYLDDVQNTKGIAIFKNYLLSLKAADSKLQIVDLKDVVKFTKGKINNSKKTISASLSFSYQELKTTKVINDFTYKKAYELSIKSVATNKMADEVLKTDINLPEGVVINSITSSIIKSDGSTIKLTFSGGNIKEQELGGFVTYEQKAKALLTSATNSDFSINNKANIFPSQFKDKQSLLNQLKAKASSLNGLAKTKVENILKIASITFNPNDSNRELEFQIVIGNIKKSFTITGLNGINTINQKIDAEVARKTMPTIKNGFKWKSANQVETTDIAITPSDDSLMARVINVSEKTNLSINIKGSIVIVTIEVSSSVVGTKTSRYDVELSGFLLFIIYADFSFLVYYNNFRINFIIDNKVNILPSSFNNINVIKNALKFKLNKINTIYFRNTNLLKIAIDNNLKVIFNPNDETGVLEFILKLGSTTRTYIVNGFKTSSS